ANDFLQVRRQRLELGLVDDQFGREARLDEAREIVVLRDLVEAQRQVVVRTDEFGRVERAGLERLEDLAGGQVGRRRAEFLPDLSAEPRGAEAQALDVLEALELVAEPATGLRAGIARQEALDAELVVDLVPDRL